MSHPFFRFMKIILFPMPSYLNEVLRYDREWKKIFDLRKKIATKIEKNNVKCKDMKKKIVDSRSCVSI